jgi:hypothetical protein
VTSYTINGTNRSENTDNWVVVFDDKGEEKWSEKIDYVEYDSIKMLKKVSDGYIGVGYIADFPDEGDRSDAESDVWVLKLKESGEVEWSRLYDLGYNEMSWDVVEVNDGYIVVGELVKRMNESAVTMEPFILKLDHSGNLEWKKFFEVGEVASAWSIAADGDVVIAGGGLDANGSFVWLSTVDSQPITLRGNFSYIPEVFGVVRVIEAQDGYLLTASGCNAECYWLGKFSLNGELLWEKTYTPNFVNQTNEQEMSVKTIKEQTKILKNGDSGNWILIASILLLLAILLFYLMLRL